MTIRLSLFSALVGVALFAWNGITAAQTKSTTYIYSYDDQGNLTREYVQDGINYRNNASFYYDSLNRRIEIFGAPNNEVIIYRYDGLDQLVSITDSRNLVTAYTIDGLGNQTLLASPDTGNTNKSYDAAGNVTSSTDAKGQTTRYQYDALNRITQIAYADSNTVTYTYDQGNNGLGRLTNIADVTGTTQYRYDQHGRITEEIRTIGGQTYTTAYRYDAAGRLAGLTYPSGRNIDYTRDNVGRISQIASTKEGITLPIVSQVTYNPFGPAQTIIFGNNQTVTRSYDLDGRVASYTLNNQAQAVSYDIFSRIAAITDTGNTANNITELLLNLVYNPKLK